MPRLFIPARGRRLLAVAVAIAVGLQASERASGSADLYGYTLADSELGPTCGYDYVDLGEDAEVLALRPGHPAAASDDFAAVLPLAEPFEFYQLPNEALVVSSNGYLAAAASLAQEDGADFSNDCRLPARADVSRLWLMPTTGTKLYTHQQGAWTPVYAELFDAAQKAAILTAFDAALEATGFVPEQTWGERIEDRGSQITFSALGQQAPIHAKEGWDPDFAKRKIIQADLRQRLPGLSINMGGATSIDITREGVDKAYGLKKLRDASGIALDAMMFIGDAIFPGGNDYPAKELGLDTVRVRDPQETLSVIDAIVACQK